jgi:hypothetical protein
MCRSAAVLLAMMATGCVASIQAYPDRPFDNAAPVLNKIDSVRVVQEFYSLGTETERRTYRDELIAERVAAINISYRHFEEQLFQEGTVRNITTDWTLLGLAATGATISVSTTQTILAAISGGIVGARAAFDKNALFDRALPSLVSKMQASRQQIELRMLNGMKLDTNSYGIIEALGDLDSYYSAGTLPGAILNIAGDAGVVKAEIQAQRTFSFKALDDPAKALTALMTGPSGGVDEVKAKQLRKCFSVIGVPTDTLIVDFLYGEEFIAKRADALACMRALPMPSAPPTPAPGGPGRRPPANFGSLGIFTPHPDASRLTGQLEALLKDPNTGLATKQRVDLALSCYPASLSKSTLPDQLLVTRSGFVKEKEAIIDCMSAADLTDQLGALLKDPKTDLATNQRVDLALSCYPASLSKSILPDQLVNNRLGFVIEKKAIVNCMFAVDLTDRLEALLKDPTTGLATKQRVDLAISCYPASLRKSILPDQLLINRLGFVNEKKAIIDCMQKA